MYFKVFLLVLCLQQCFAENISKRVCSLPSDSGPCEAAIPRYFYNKRTKQCEQFTYGGCDGNGNNFETKEACEQRCARVCNLPAKPGLCEAYIPRFFFNSKTGKCESFIYGGCGANANNFETKEACEQRCVPVCNLPAKPGLCEAHIPRFFFNSKTGKCESFIYGGCGANANNFETKEACLARCGKQ